MIHGRLINLSLLRLIVLLLFLQSIKLAVNFPCDVIKDDADGFLAEINLWFDLDCDELKVFLLFPQITVTHER